MMLYSQCRRCRGLLHVTDYGQTVHPGCLSAPTRVEQLTAAWLAAAEADDPSADALEAQIGELDSRPPRLLEAALAYAGWGWMVFPLQPRSKIPATRHGFKDATTDVDRIKTYWGRHPTANIGLPTGLMFDVVDLDGPTGVESYDRLLTADKIPDVHGRVSTPHGVHLYIKARGIGCTASSSPGVDYRGVGGYVAAPPSVVDDGRWTWMMHPSPKLTRQGDTYGVG